MFLFDRLGWAKKPHGTDWLQLLAVSVIAGIGFTMSLFIGALAFSDADMQLEAKLGVLIGSGVSAVAGALAMSYALYRRRLHS